ncbi:MAG: DUF4403 family protein [Cytophagaceae bacterium]|nr:DUF4403 family protein [Cytophagaceae bacterium]
MKFILFFCSALFVALTSCTTVKPAAPVAAYTPFVFKPELSKINIPVEISVKTLENNINHHLTGLLYEDNNLNDDDMMIKIWKKENISLSVAGEEFHYKVPLKVWMKTGFKVEKLGMTFSDYEEVEFSLRLNFTSTIAVKEDWKVITSTKFTGHEWIQKPEIDLGLFQISLGYFADKVIESQQQKIPTLIDEQAKNFLEIKKYVQDAWKVIQDPVSLSEDPKSWLKVTPVEVQMTPLMGRAGMIQASMGMQAYSYVHLGEKPVVPVVPLGKLKLTHEETGFFSIAVVSDILYDYAESLAKKYLEGQEYSFKDGKKKVKIDNIQLYGSQNKIVLALEVSGNVKGKIFLKGVPYYHQATKSIKIKDMEFDLDTKNKLLKSADWLAHDIFIKKIESNFSFSIQEELKETEDLLAKSLTNNRINKNVLLNGRLTEVAVKDIFLTEDSMKAVILIKGIMNVNIDNLD